MCGHDPAVTVCETQQCPGEARRESCQGDILNQTLEVGKTVGDSGKYPAAKLAVTCQAAVEISR